MRLVSPIVVKDVLILVFLTLTLSQETRRNTGDSETDCETAKRQKKGIFQQGENAGETPKGC
jgi:hypothetical protein